MNREQRLNRVKRVRLAQERHGSGADLGDISPKAEQLAKDKTPKVQRVGNYFVKVKQGVRQQYTNVVPKNKFYAKQPEPGLFAAYWAMLKSRFHIKNIINNLRGGIYLKR